MKRIRLRMRLFFPGLQINDEIMDIPCSFWEFGTERDIFFF
jgi:hypothetical protein